VTVFHSVVAFIIDVSSAKERFPDKQQNFLTIPWHSSQNRICREHPV